MYSSNEIINSGVSKKIFYNRVYIKNSNIDDKIILEINYIKDNSILIKILTIDKNNINNILKKFQDAKFKIIVKKNKNVINDKISNSHNILLNDHIVRNSFYNSFEQKYTKK